MRQDLDWSARTCGNFEIHKAVRSPAQRLGSAIGQGRHSVAKHVARSGCITHAALQSRVDSSKARLGQSETRLTHNSAVHMMGDSAKYRAAACSSLKSFTSRRRSTT